MAPRAKSKAVKSAPARVSAETRRAEAKTVAVKAATRTAPRKPAESKRHENGNGQHAVIGEVAEKSAREVFESLTRWQGEVATAAEEMVGKLSETDAQEGMTRFSSLLSNQRQLLEQIKTTLSQFQELLESCEKQLEAQAKGTGDKAGGVQRPAEMPLHALQSFQQIALSNIGVWTKIAQDAQGLWLGAMQLWVPKGKGKPTAAPSSEEHH